MRGSLVGIIVPLVIDASGSYEGNALETSVKYGSTTQKTTREMDIATIEKEDATIEKDDTTIEKENTTIEKDDTTIERGNTPQETTIEKSEMVLNLLRKNPKLSNKELAVLIGDITIDGVNYHLKKLRDKGVLKHIGPRKGGHWEIL